MIISHLLPKPDLVKMVYFTPKGSITLIIDAHQVHNFGVTAVLSDEQAKFMADNNLFKRPME